MKSLDNSSFYTKSFNEHGISALGVHWSSKEVQYKRFEVLSEFIKTDIKTSSLIDIGCGYAEYLKYLKKENLNPKEYLGIDCEEFMIDIASKRFEDEVFMKCNVLKNLIPKADYLVCSGAFNLLNSLDFLKAIENCFNASKKGFAFNYLSSQSIHQLPQKVIIKYCQSFTKKITIKDKYLEADCSIFLEK